MKSSSRFVRWRMNVSTVWNDSSFVSSFQRIDLKSVSWLDWVKDVHYYRDFEPERAYHIDTGFSIEN